MNKKLVGLGVATLATLALAACGSRAAKNDADSMSEKDSAVKAAVVTDVGGVDDRSFNQSAWEGLQAWGDENGLKKDAGYTYFQSGSESDYVTNLDSAVSGGYNLVFGIGFALENAIAEVAPNNPDTNYVIVDSVVKDQKNVASVGFADHEASYLAGVAAAKATKTNHVGFIGGVEGVIIDRFEAGFVAGAKSVNKDIKITVDYAASFADAAKGQTLAAAQYAAGADVIFHASGGTGNGVFAAAKAENETRNEADKVWVIGVDRDQSAEGKYTSKDGKESNFVLASTLKQVGTSVKDLANKALKGEFPGGEIITFSLADKGVDLAETNLSSEASEAVAAAKKDILDKKVEVPETPEKK
ncbi:BMP family ABC transporter substrate-binding protein [Streptococcus sp. zg-86]|uniref:BMP family ABC transporter substrate-binding protein n=1 Tax=Streptococcus zhangguiae TaxID=2664091 RepID=A0A6I4RBB5_9STRE|nr:MULTISPECIES: BMP family ABC transporter substrate-binding protein [unclassified Streptococcus]MTB63980.1 BMP family ABC transporter substrate-binding protein [Streptococcus sp. zg-86]MTB90290.1 BMP family ABC transporter substrate-binding protein [Streptococcus sp. zg-36]MWV55968.1 BMP family ABC transporter substrate-binding protein [Streptococcus sp. zg-70]QTH47007.1 BMP family ABC transporter substrate-binding protein [Streptococcus sp. zg-86]